MAASLREKQAQLTRTLVMDATYRLLLEVGYTRTTIASIAERAGVAVPTVYKAFGTKPDLIKQVYDRTLIGDDADVPLAQRPQAAQILAEHDPRQAVAAYAALAADLAHRLGPLLGVLLSARHTDPHLEAFVATIERERLAGNQRFAEHLQKCSDATVSVDLARDVLWLYTAPEVHYRLVQQRGWSRRRFTEWLDSTLAGQLLGKP